MIDYTASRTQLIVLIEMQLASVLAAHRQWIESSGEQGVRLNLAGEDLSHACLARANLTDASLYRANLTDADLTDVNLTNTLLRNAE